MKKLNVFDNFGFVLIPGIAIVSFSQFLVVLFGQTIPNTFLSFFKEASFAIILAVAFIFAITWFWRTIPHNRPKNYSIISFDVFGQESRIDGLRTEFKTHDVAWNFMKQYKKSYPLYGFALVSDPPKSDKKTILKYI